jgi:hypothetical protein
MAASSPHSTSSQQNSTKSSLWSLIVPLTSSELLVYPPPLAYRPVPQSHIILDTPGQIEIFTWSASGTIITDAMAASYPTVIAYIIDTPRTTAPATFMSNMLYACRSV